MVEHRPSGPHAGGVPTIAELIATQRDSTGYSYRQMADRAARAGHELRHQTLQQLATGTPKGWPKTVDTFHALAAALEVSERTIVLSFARSFGLDVAGDDSLLVTLLPSTTGNVPSEVQASIASLVATIAAVQGRDPHHPPIAHGAARRRALTGGGAIYDADAALERVGQRRSLSSKQRDRLRETIESEVLNYDEAVRSGAEILHGAAPLEDPDAVFDIHASTDSESSAADRH